jgi:subtilase family serine protease
VLPDLVVGGSTVLEGNKLFVTVMNQGTGDANGDIVVAVFNADGTALLGGATLPNFSLPAGRSIDVATGYTVESSQSLLLIVDPNGTLEESDNLNNRITVSIEVGGGPPTPDPFAATPTPPPPPPVPGGVITP